MRDDDATLAAIPATRRRRVTVRGIVQGVGFRPFVVRLAARHALAGHVRNDGVGVTIEVEGSPERLAAFERSLRDEAPPRARVERMDSVALAPGGATGFEVRPSVGGAIRTAIGPDTAVCAQCLGEMFDPADRRWRYAFVNCTHCGPRYTITRALPYDRARTSMSHFAMCAQCAAEYRAIGDRRFHAEPIACPRCGPTLRLAALDGEPAVGDPVAAAVARLRAGAIVAVKGLGGFHLACDARDPRAVARLRERKGREEKPLAVLALNAASLGEWADIGEAQGRLLESAERPIVLLEKRPGCDRVLPGIAPGLAWLGAMLPYTPLHYLLFHEALGRPAGTGWLHEPSPWLLVMTSANPGGEPLVCTDDEAFARLGGIADALLTHDREIVVRCDDSVARVAAGGGAQFLRRARGETPRAIPLSRNGPPVLALGAALKSTVCLTRGAQAFVSQHLGDLDTAQACAFLEETVAHLRRILAVEPAVIAHDLHPDFHSSRLAAALADALAVPRVAVQHHHAHVAAVLAEHRVDDPVVGLALDGFGLGADDGAWGGELLLVDAARFERLGHLWPLRLPGADRAAREPWRMAASALHAIGRRDEIVARFADRAAASTVATMLDRGLNAPPTSSMGRWFDAAAALLGLHPVASYEGQAAMALEGLARGAPLPERTEAMWRIGADGVLDLRPLVAELADRGAAGAREGGVPGRPAPGATACAALFHASVADALAAWAADAARRCGTRQVAAAGGCVLNAALSQRLRARLADAGVELLEARAVPPNDAGVSLGQAWVAQRRLEQAGRPCA